MLIFNEAKPKYEKLDELFGDIISNIKYSNQVNVIIDLKDITKKFFRPDISVENYEPAALIEEISSDILNTVAHYRNYFYKKNKYSTYFILFSRDKCQNFIDIYPEYKKEYYEKYLDKETLQTKIIDRVCDVLEKIIINIPHVYFIETSDCDEFVYAKFIKEQMKKNEITLLLTNDIMFYQLLDNESTFLLTPKGIKAELITQRTSLNTLTEIEEIKFSPNIISLLMSLSGVKKYSIKNIPGIGMNKAVKLLETLVKSEKVEELNTIELPIKISKLENNKVDDIITKNLDLISLNYKLIRGDEIYSKNKFSIITKFSKHDKIGSPNFFKQLNSNVFINFPINIDMLLKGEKI